LPVRFSVYRIVHADTGKALSILRNTEVAPGKSDGLGGESWMWLHRPPTLDKRVLARCCRFDGEVRMSTGPIRRASVPIGAAVPSLVRWGLSCDADLVFRTIATFGPRSASMLAAELGVPVHRVDSALAELLTVGAAISVTDQARAGRPAPVWATRSPADVVTMLRSRRLRPVAAERQGRAHHQAVMSLTDRRGATSSLLTGPAPTGGMLGDGVRYLASRAAARERLAELIAIERQEHLAINTEQAFDAASARAAAPLDQQILQRGVRMRVIGLPPADQDLHVGAASLAHPRCGYRETPHVPLKLVVIDHNVAFFPADPSDLERGYLEISQPGVVRALVMLFEQHWANAINPRERGMEDIVLDDRELELIMLLADGHTDVSAAAQLRISARSVTNIMRGVMDRLGVDNRFQLGLALGAARVAHPAIRSTDTPSTTEVTEA
jgi:DNA-binding CsgD family transcriptional regulator